MVLLLFSLCIAIECDDLDDLANGEVIYNSTVYRSVATYSCQYGYKLVGVSVRICRENGQWSGEKPVCESELFELLILMFT